MIKDKNFDILPWQIKFTLKYEKGAIGITSKKLIKRYVKVDDRYRSSEIEKIRKGSKDKNIYAEVFLATNGNGVLKNIEEINLYCSQTLDYVQICFENNKIVFSTEEQGKFLVNNEAILNRNIYWPQGIIGLFHAMLSVEHCMELTHHIQPIIRKRILDTLSENFENSKMQLI